MSCTKLLTSVDALRQPGYDPHMLRPANSLADLALAPPGQSRFWPALDLAHLGDKMRHQLVVESFVHRVDAEFAEGIEAFCFMARRAEQHWLAGGFPDRHPSFHAKVGGVNELHRVSIESSPSHGKFKHT